LHGGLGGSSCPDVDHVRGLRSKVHGQGFKKFTREQNIFGCGGMLPFEAKADLNLKL